MTGFGCGEVETRRGKFAIELKTVNHRYFDMTSKLPMGFLALEGKIKEHVQKRIHRGKVSLYIRREGGQEVYGEFTIDKKLAFSYNKLLGQLKKDLDLAGNIRLEQIASFPNIITYKQEEANLDRSWPSIKRALGQALDGLIRMRELEGKALASDLNRRINTIEKILVKLEGRSSVVVNLYRDRLSARVKNLTEGLELDEDRLSREVAFFAERSDISEEITRIRSHLNSFREMLSSDEGAGRTLNFIAQEMYREANTISSKSEDYELSSDAIAIKGEVEKIREQVQNVE
jgi:uncharacterized protein (TIGR00255 family)